jgi:hypothetical protein
VFHNYLRDEKLEKMDPKNQANQVNQVGATRRQTTPYFTVPWNGCISLAVAAVEQLLDGRHHVALRSQPFTASLASSLMAIGPYSWVSSLISAVILLGAPCLCLSRISEQPSELCKENCNTMGKQIARRALPAPDGKQPP